jgi:hypothetical protein
MPGLDTNWTNLLGHTMAAINNQKRCRKYDERAYNLPLDRRKSAYQVFSFGGLC